MSIDALNELREQDDASVDDFIDMFHDEVVELFETGSVEFTRRLAIGEQKFLLVLNCERIE